jgi:hypothetical protein
VDVASDTDVGQHGGGHHAIVSRWWIARVVCIMQRGLADADPYEAGSFGLIGAIGTCQPIQAYLE